MTALSGALRELLDGSRATSSERVEVLFASALVTEALRPYWSAPQTPSGVQSALRSNDPELADVLQVLAPYLLARRTVRTVAEAATAEAERLLASEEQRRP